MAKKSKWIIVKNLVMSFKKENMVEFLKEISFYLFLFIFIYMNVTFYIRPYTSYIQKFIMGLFMGGLEVVAVWLLFQTKKVVVKTWNDFPNIVKIAGIIILYLGLSIPSITSRVAFTIESVQQQQKIQESTSKDIDQNSLTLHAMDVSLANLNEKLNNANSYSTNSNAVRWYKDDLVAKITAKTKERERFINAHKNVEKTQEVSTEDAYTVIGKPFSIAGITMFTIMLVIRLFFLDICIILIVFIGNRKKNQDKSVSLNNPEEKLADYVRKNQANLITYINALYNTVTPKRLNSDKDISKLTKIPVHICKDFRKHLRTDIQWSKVPVLLSGKGNCSANFSKDDAIKLINSYARLY